MSQVFVSHVVLLIILTLAILSRNNPLAIAVTILLLISLLGQLGGGFKEASQYIFRVFDKYGLRLGLIILMIGIMTPLADGTVDIRHLLDISKSLEGIVALLSGILVAVLAAKGSNLLELEPELVTTIVIGTILGIVIFRGYPVGPLIGSGIAALVFKIIKWVS